MSVTCIVPGCLNTQGIPLSKNKEYSEKLLQIHKLDKNICTAESFICLQHLNIEHLLEDTSETENTKHTVVDTKDCYSNASVLMEESTENGEKDLLPEKLCRVCLSKEYLDKDIFEYIEENITIANAITFCVYPIKIVEDHLPRNICQSCFETLKITYKFYKKCLVTDKILQIKYQRRKRKFVQAEIQAKKLKDTINESSSKDDSTFEIMFETDLKPELASSNCKLDTAKLHLADFNIDEVERNMEVIHRDGVKSTNKPTTKSESQNTINEFLGKLVTSRPENIITKPSTSKDSSDVFTNRLSPSIKIKRVQQHKSNVGKFKALVRVGIHESVFVQVDSYLFEHGLLKDSIRHLRCTLPNCPATGKQPQLGSGKYNDMVEILTPHNHEPPNEITVRKHMFLCWMRKKMQTDKTANIRNIYEDACIQDPDIKQIIPLRNVVNEICRHQLTHKISNVTSFEMFFKLIETDAFEKLHFTHCNQQFYQEKFYVKEDESMAVVFANTSVIQQLSDSQIMYVDASFKIDTNEDFKYQLVTVLLWMDESYFPILFALVNKKSQLIFRRVFAYLHDELSPELRPQEIVTDYEANIYYALAEVYMESSIGGSVFYYTQNLYKKLCSLNLSRDLETNSYFRNIYHMLLMLPLLPVNTILDGLNSIEIETKTLNISQLARPLFDHVRTQWILNVTPELFCVHKLESRINENVIAPFKKLRDFLLLTKGKGQKTQITITYVVEKLIELEYFLRNTYSKVDKKSFGRDLSSSQKKNVIRAWQYIEEHPKIEMSNFFAKVLGYIKCMENQLWIWGFYRYDGDTDDILINASHFSIELQQEDNMEEDEHQYIQVPGNTIILEAVVDRNGILQPHANINKQIET